MSTKGQPNDKRPSWDSYFISLCDTVSTRASCDRKHVGAVLVKNRRILATGYNGSIPGLPHCSGKQEWICKNCGNQYQDQPIRCTRIVMPQDSPHQLIGSNDTCYGDIVPMVADHDMDHGHCVRTIHAEVNVIAQAARLGVATEDTTLYCNTLPCWNCFKTIISAGITEVVYRDEYRPELKNRVTEASSQLKHFKLRRFQDENT